MPDNQGIPVRPTNPLPWHCTKFTDTKSTSVYCRGGERSLASIRDAADAAYAVHAGNAYLRLVEFVKQFAELQGPGSHMRLDAEMFLRELGEKHG